MLDAGCGLVTRTLRSEPSFDLDSALSAARAFFAETNGKGRPLPRSQPPENRMRLLGAARSAPVQERKAQIVHRGQFTCRHLPRRRIRRFGLTKRDCIGRLIGQLAPHRPTAAYYAKWSSEAKLFVSREATCRSNIDKPLGFEFPGGTDSV